MLVLTSLDKWLLLRSNLSIIPWLHIHSRRAHCHTFRVRDWNAIRGTLSFLLLLRRPQAFRPGLDIGEMLGRLVLVLQTTSHDFEEVVALVANLIRQIRLCLLDKLSDCWLLMNSVLIDNCAKWVISVLILWFKQLLFASVKAMRHLLLYQCTIFIFLVWWSTDSDCNHLSFWLCQARYSVIVVSRLLSTCHNWISCLPYGTETVSTHDDIVALIILICLIYFCIILLLRLLYTICCCQVDRAVLSFWIYVSWLFLMSNNVSLGSLQGALRPWLIHLPIYTSSHW